MRTTEFNGENPNVKKFVFEYEDAILESVLYKYPTYEERTVLCISVQSGCPVGCTFCGTGNKFIRNLTDQEITNQVSYIFEKENIDTNSVKKLQIMFMSQGEPLLNWNNVSEAICRLESSYPNADLLLSSIGPKKRKELNYLLFLSKETPKLGLQFSIHKSNDRERDELIPFKNKSSLLEIRNYGIEWWKATGRKVYLNYCIDGTNNTAEDFSNLLMLFPPNVFCFTFSVVCSSEAGGFEYRDLDEIRKFENLFVDNGYNTRVFDPAGQDDIGAGCGQLWYTREWMKNREEK